MESFSSATSVRNRRCVQWGNVSVSTIERTHVREKAAEGALCCKFQAMAIVMSLIDH